MSNYAWVTLATNDSYSLGALVVANSLKKVNTSHQTAVLITPGVSESMKSKLEATFNAVIEVNVLDSKDAANLALLSRPELGITFTKLHCWRLTQFEKCVFLDADTFVLQNCDELFDREELSAAPDVGWPDCFNSGVFVFRPSLDTFGKLIEFATTQGSFDGGDQGLLNSFFSDWARTDISKHLPFIYNTCSTACYSYLPAFKQFGQNVKILHFIGQVKPWIINFDSSSKTAHAPQGFGHLGEYLQQWWNIFCDDVHPALTTEMGGLAGALAQVTLGAPRSAEQQAYEESMRRQCWEAGNIDYLGKDSFDNIWKRITKTIETKNDTPPPTEKNRSPTPQPEEKLAVEQKKEVKVGPTFNESDEDVLSATQIHEQTVTEVTSDGRIIEKKIVTYPGEETTEIEEIEEVDGQTMSVKRSVIGSEKKAVQPKPKTLAEIKSEPVVLVPGYRTVEIDEKTNSTIVTEKTTTGYQQTITITQEDGTKKIQTKTFYDPVEIPGEEEEEETYEETEIIEPSTQETTVTTITGVKDVVDCDVTEKDAKVEISDVKSTQLTQQKINEPEAENTKESTVLTELKNQAIVIVPGHQKVEFDKETNTTTVTEKTTTGYQQTISTVTTDGRTLTQTKVFYDPVLTEQVEEVETTTTVTEASATSAENISETQDEKEKDATVTTTDVKDLQLVLAAPGGPTSLTQKKTTTAGKEIEVTTTVSEDGKTKTLRKTVRKPSEEIEIEEYEETETYEPGEVTVTTTAKTIPLVDALEDAAKDIVDTSKKVIDTSKAIVDTSKTVVDAKNKVDAITTTATAVQEQVKAQTNVTAKKTSTATKQTTTAAKQAVTEAKPSTSPAKPAATKQTTTETKQTTTEALTQGKQSAIDSKQIKKETKQDQADVSAKKSTNTKINEKDTKTTATQGKSTTASKKDDTTTKSKTVTGIAKKEAPVKTSTKTSTEVAPIGEPIVTTKDGETTTEVVRRVPGGTEHTWTTVRADGSKKTESKTCFDTVELSSSEEEYEEVIEEDTLPAKTLAKLRGAAAVGAKGPKTPIVTEATPPNSPPLKPLNIGGHTSDLNVEHEILDTPPLDKAEELRKKKLQSAPASKAVPKVDKTAVEAPKPPPRKKEVKKPATGK